MLYQCIQEEYGVLQIGPSTTEKLKEFLSDRLFHTQTMVFSLWWGNIQKNMLLTRRMC